MTHLCNLTLPQHEYQAAQRVIQRFIQTFGLTALEKLAPRRCAPEAHQITRFMKDPERWSLDTGLHFAASEVWRRPAKVIIKKTGLCAWCSQPARGMDHPLAQPLAAVVNP